jgi:drug/metabolite transporter (DMT)-like permease
MSGAASPGAVPVLPVLAVLAAAACFAQSTVLVHRAPPVHPVVLNAIGMPVGAAILLGLSLLLGERWTLPTAPSTWVALVYLVVVGSVVVFVLFAYVVRHWTASRAAYVFVLIPFVTVLLSARLDAEPVTVGLVTGGLLVLAGVYVGALRRAGATRGR